MNSRTWKNIFFGMTCTLFAVTVPQRMMADEGDLTGIYSGSMHLTDGEVRDIPLSVSLNLTDETVSTPSGMEYIIDGAFLVDDEGGPYVFTKVGYDIEGNRLDMKYSRPRMDPSTTAPASFRLTGALAAEGDLIGNVFSGSLGQIGTSKVSKNKNLTSLPIRKKYLGAWEGLVDNIPYDKTYKGLITLQAASTSTLNPPGMEFDFTPSKLGGYSVDDVWVAKFSQVVIDYLRRKIVMTSDSGMITVEIKADFDNNTITGFQSSSAYGLTTRFNELSKVK